MKRDEWLAFFRQHHSKKFFSLPDIVLLSGDRKALVSVQLSRLVKSGIVERPVRGWYANPFTQSTADELAMVIRHPSYISMEYALSKQGILSQNVFTITLVTTRLPYIYRTDETTLEYHQIKRTLFWGYESQDTVLIAEPEKALLDLIYIRYTCGKDLKRGALDSLMDDMYLEELNHEKLLLYAEDFDKTSRMIITESLS